MSISRAVVLAISCGLFAIASTVLPAAEAKVDAKQTQGPPCPPPVAPHYTYTTKIICLTIPSRMIPLLTSDLNTRSTNGIEFVTLLPIPDIPHKDERGKEVVDKNCALYFFRQAITPKK